MRDGKSNLDSIIARAKGQQPSAIQGPEIPEQTRAEMGRAVKAARAESDLIIPEDGIVEDLFMVVGLAFIDALTDKHDLASAYRHLFPRASQHKRDHAGAEGARLLELVKASFPSVGDFMRRFFSRAGIHPAWLVSILKQIAEEGRDTEKLAALRVILRLMELDAPEQKINAMIGAAVIVPQINPLPQREIVDAEVVHAIDAK